MPGGSVVTTAPDLVGGGPGARRGVRPHVRLQNVQLGDDR